MSMTKAEEKSVRKTAKRVIKRTAASPRVKKSKSARAIAAQNAKHQDRRTFILNYAARLFGEKGYAMSSMDNLAAATKLNKSTLYYYYTSKSAILYDIYNAAQTSTQDLIMPATKMNSAVDGMTHLISVLVKWVIQNQVYARVFSQEAQYIKSIFSKSAYSLLSESKKKFIGVIYKVLRQGCASGEFRPLDLTMTTRFIIQLTFLLYPSPEPEIDIDSTVASVSEFILRAIKR